MKDLRIILATSNYPLTTKLLPSGSRDEFSFCGGGDYDGFRVSLPKKKRERYLRAKWRVRKIFREGKYHCRVAA